MDVSSVTSKAAHAHNKNIVRKPNFSSWAIRKYCATRFSSLFVPREELADTTWSEILNPFQNLGQLTARQWNFFFVGFCGWTWDAFDFFTVSLNVTRLARSFDVTVKQVTWGITLVLMLRSVGAVIFGLWGDRYGRKWPYIFNMGLLMVLQIGLGFVKTYDQFLAVRALFGIAMGGMFGNCAAIALDDCPTAARGIVSGIFQQGYALGYLLVVIFQRAITDNSPYTWRALCWFSAGPPVIFMLWRYFLPETNTYIKQSERRALERRTDGADQSKAKSFAQEGVRVMKQYWLITIYAILLMSGFNFMSHGSQDLYPTMLTKQLQYGPDRSTVTNTVANLGAIFGGIVFGHSSTYIGRRFAIIIAAILGGVMVYPWAFVRNSGINAGAFFLQAGVQGAWGVVPIHLSELSPPQFRSFFTGVSYQLGNLCSSASSTIVSTLGERFPLPELGEDVYDYAKVMAIFVGCVFGYMIIITFVGPEYRGANLDVSRNDELEIDDVKASESLESDDVKPQAQHTEKV
ncbi:carboxylic acid transporter protein homolog [[Candida] anglica]|uniref:Carboxylic acid transporter protein homolog n=1 Tax=[Candida] anglica TaxID=148631 RepID=A0ABP0E7J6_9ASCO